MAGISVIVCDECGQTQLEPAILCRKCGSEKIGGQIMSDTGALYSYTSICVPPEDWKHSVPYVVGIIRMQGGLLLTARYAGNQDSLSVNDKFTVSFTDGEFLFYE